MCRTELFHLCAVASRDWQWGRNIVGRRSWNGGALRGHEGGGRGASGQEDKVN